tara:strand:+ start:10079 stop:10606 length:528 start_codon:yes stop_codon:yes gene_type:complete
MIKKRNILFLLVNLILGFAVILSYIWGLVYYPEYGSALWGKIETNNIPYIIFSMLLAAVGYFVFSFYFLNYKKFQTFNTLEYLYILSLYIVILFFSALWMPLSIGFINTNNNLFLILDLVSLYLVGISSLLLTIFLIQDKSLRRKLIWKLSVLGGFQFTFHTLIIDAIYWGMNFI